MIYLVLYYNLYIKKVCRFYEYSVNSNKTVLPLENKPLEQYSKSLYNLPAWRIR
jgi:hypothetical protein